MLTADDFADAALGVGDQLNEAHALFARMPVPYPLQREVVDNHTRYKVVGTGRRVGKTTLGVHHTIERAIERKIRCWWIAPTNQPAYLAWVRFKTFLGGYAEISESRKQLILPNGSEIWCKSAQEPDNLRGEGVDLMTLDEAAHIKKLDYVWSAILRPMLIDTTGSMLALSSPNRRNVFYQWFLRGLDPLEPEWQSWNAPTFANVHLPPHELEGLLQEYPPGSELYKQEILGEFLEDSGQVFRRIREAATAPTDATPQDGHVYVAGLDWGKSQDFTVLTILDATTKEMVAIDRFNLVDYVLQRDRIKAACNRWRVSKLIPETNAAGEPNIEMLMRERWEYSTAVIPFTTTAQSKRPLIEGLAQAFELGLLKILPDRLLIGELESYERKTSANTGVSTYSAPDSGHDDCVMSLALAWHGINMPSPTGYLDYVEIR